MTGWKMEFPSLLYATTFDTKKDGVFSFQRIILPKDIFLAPYWIRHFVALWGSQLHFEECSSSAHFNKKQKIELSSFVNYVNYDVTTQNAANCFRVTPPWRGGAPLYIALFCSHPRLVCQQVVVELLCLSK